MAVSVRKLNADTTFHFTFSSGEDDGPALRVLIDPWLSGDSTWLHPSFQFSSHTVPPTVPSLADIEDEVDIIIISQDKPDHCHRETLCSWPKEKSVEIYATTAAAKKIKEWKHFDIERIHELTPYHAGDEQSLYHVGGPSGQGELVVANLMSRKDLTGLHNAIALTYRSSSATTCSLSKMLSASTKASMVTPPDSPELSRSPLDAGQSFLAPPSLRARIRSYSSLRSDAQRSRNAIATPPQTPDDQPCISCIYTPHGVSAALVEPYLQRHLVASNALPLTMLVHSMTVEQNPWFMGGVIAAGAPGGVEIVKLLAGQVKHWIAAHDEVKDNRGMSVKLLKTHRYQIDEVHTLLEREGFGNVKLACLDPGEELKMLR